LCTLTSDDRIPFDFKLKGHVQNVKEFGTKEERNRRREDKKILLAGGLTNAEIEELNRIGLERSKRIIQNPQLLNELTSMNGGIFFIATGIKPRDFKK
jgi:hypothetical protein